ncbi:uncharacterized protein LOC6031743 [Culex quinquefasciatus]|uniref:uncharacterized protein LOC6031743 n=1 Tax=Culex quinquefasciatus TaxID=7176 RepID=UPI0018E3BE5E|nr:uncharacterized protein LOC6031743 [Culex quinquefasciatus]
MKLLVTLILALKLISFQRSFCLEKRAIIVAEPSNVINLENTTAYSVFCVLTNASSEENIAHLSIYEKSKHITSEILNATTIVARVNVEQNATCHRKIYSCKANKPEGPQGLALGKIYFGRPPALFPPHDFVCISEHKRHIHCQFPAEIKCDMDTSFKLGTLTRVGFSECITSSDLKSYHWDSRNGSCAFSMKDLNTSLKLVVRNEIDERNMMFNVSHEDIVRPAKPSLFTASQVTATTAEVTWHMSELNVLRQFKYEFRLISVHGVGSLSRFVTVPKMISSYLVEDLIPHTIYTLEVRVQVLPEVLRPFDDLYWSECASVTFKTAAHRPITAPAVAQGVYNIKKRTADQMNVSVFWEPIPDHLHNGTGFGYRVTAVSDSGNRFTKKVNLPTCTFSNLLIGHYKIQVSSFNNEGESETYNELQIFPRIDNRQPQIRSVFKSGGYNVSWFAPEKANPSSYTLMYCHFTSQATCHKSTQFVTLPAARAFFVTTQDSALNFAVAANYPDNYSSELSWQHCVVAPRTSRLAVPKYHVESISADSMTVRMMGRCEEHSYYARMQILVRALDGQLAMNESYDHFVEEIVVGRLKSSTDYGVNVTVFDEFGKSEHEVTRRTTASSGIWILILVLAAFGAAAMVFIMVVAVRRLKCVLDIKVDVPIGLLEDQEDSVEESEADDHEEYYNLTCPPIPEESESVAEEIHYPKPASTSEEPAPTEPVITAPQEIPTTGGGCSYIEMTSWKRPPGADQPDGNGNYEQMHPPNKHSVIVRSTVYVQMNLFINRARTGNYRQTIV